MQFVPKKLRLAVHTLQRFVAQRWGNYRYNSTTQRGDPHENELYELWRKARAEDQPRIKDQLFKKIIRHARAVIAQHLRESSPDLEQEIAQAVVRALPGFKGHSEFSTWVHAIALNKVRDEMRRRTRERKVMDRMVEVPGEDDDGALLSKWSYHPDIENKVFFEQILDSLPPRDSTLLQHKVEGRTHEEIGNIQGISAHAVEGRWQRLKRTVQEKLSDVGRLATSSRD